MEKQGENGWKQAENGMCEQPRNRDVHIVIVNGVPVDVRKTKDIFAVKSRPDSPQLEARRLEREAGRRTKQPGQGTGDATGKRGGARILVILFIALFILVDVIAGMVSSAGKKPGKTKQEVTFTTARGGKETSEEEAQGSLEEEQSLVYPDGTTDERAYITPVKLGDDVQDMRMLLDGALYQFPFPVTELLEKGWSIKDTTGDISEDTEVEPHHVQFVTLQNPDGRELDCELLNVSSDTASVRDCAVEIITEFSIDPAGVTMSGGIDTSITEAQMDQLLAAAGPATDDSLYEKNEKDGYIDYTLRYPSKKLAEWVWVRPILHASFTDEEELLFFWYGADISFFENY